jgi:signal transduction histidine kinase/ActR/RegA family two-component response regulator
MLGWSRDEYVGHPIAEFHADRRAFEEMAARLRRGETVLDHPARMGCKDGSIKSVLVDASVLRIEGRFVHTQCFTRDVTERTRVESEREETNRRKDEFIAILAHELRNPLAPVRTAARYLALKTGADSELARPIAIVERQAAQMSRLIDDLLDVSRMSRGVLALRPERVACVDVVDAAIDACRDELQAKGHELRVEMPAEHVELEADRERLVQILCNVLGNAIRYTPAHGRIGLRVVARDHTLEVDVRDDGIGIPPGKLEEIFDLFARVDRSLERQGGLGIGLTLVRQLVELHGGTIEARSAGVGRGSEFVLTLPIVVSAEPAPVVVPEARPASAPLRVLVADDNEDAVESLAMVLELAGHDVQTALDGEQAIAVFERHRPDVALVDIGMPKANGYDVARAIRAHASGTATYLVAVTGWGQESDRARAQEAGFDAHLVKPVAPHALEALFADVANEATTRARRSG